MKHHFRAFLALILVVCLFAGIGGAVCAVDAGDGSGTQGMLRPGDNAPGLLLGLALPLHYPDLVLLRGDL